MGQAKPMAILMRVTCPECGAGLKADDPAGFEVGQALECPKCETYFAVEAPRAAAVAKPVAKAKKPVVVVEDEDDDDDRPSKKRRRDYDDEEEDRPRKKRKSEESAYTRYRKSPIRVIVLGVLIVILIVMAVLLKMKWDREKEDQSRIDVTGQIGM
jgi:DNA-directed RNA polymerase subunit M/transcription elongation factor TFIIS